MVRITKYLAASLIVCAMAVGCSKKEEQKTEPVSPHGQQGKKESVVVVPDNVKGKWKAVKIKVTDKTSNKDAVYTVAVGSQVAIPGSSLALKVETFLPHFIMDGTTLTSQSNEAKNPAVQIKVYDGKNEIYKGWLFSLYPNTHKFEHPKYGFSLVDFVPAS